MVYKIMDLKLALNDYSKPKPSNLVPTLTLTQSLTKAYTETLTLTRN